MRYEPFHFFAHRGLLIVPALVMLNGLAPYAGLKTENSFAMFSNVRTEGGKTNHLLIPSSAQVFDYQKDLVTVSSSSEAFLQDLAMNEVAVPFFTLREHISRRAAQGAKNIKVVYTRAGAERSVQKAESDPLLATPPSWLERKLLVFREVDKGSHQTCKH